MSFTELYVGVLARVSVKRRAIWVVFYAVVFLLVFAPIAAFSYSRFSPTSEPGGHLNNTCTSASCHGSASSKAKLYLAINGLDVSENPTIAVQQGDAFEIDLHFTDMLNDVKKYSGVGFEIAGPTAPAWRISAGTVNHPVKWSQNGTDANFWSNAWDRTGAGDKGIPAKWTTVQDKLGTFYLDFSATQWSVVSYAAAANDRGEGSAADLDKVANHAGADALIGVPNDVKPGNYKISVSGVGHDSNGNKASVTKIILVEVKERNKESSAPPPIIDTNKSASTASQKGAKPDHFENQACGSCHKSNVKVSASHTGRSSDTCGQCHVQSNPSKPPLTGAPKVSHGTEGREACLVCHGAGGLKILSDSHKGRVDSQCLGCHQTAVSSGGISPKIPHKLEGKENCLACHASGFIEQMPADHSNRGKETCLGCHTGGKQVGAPGIPHSTEGRGKCSTCHGPGKLDPLGLTHTGRDDSTCLSCHSRNAGSGPALPKIPHETETKSQCLECHGPSGIRPVPVTHAGRANDSCASCHRSATDSAGGLPKIPHVVDGRSDCLECHQNGFLRPVSDRHNGRSSDICIGCHQSGELAGVKSEALPIPHSVLNRENCLVCHGATGFIPVSSSHSGRSDSSCTSCHKAPKSTVGSTPNIPHEMKGREQCLDCHQSGFLTKLPASHKDRNNATCTACHIQSQAATEGAKPLPRIPHDGNARQECRVCHGGGFVTQIPKSHQGKSNDSCSQCHQLADLTASKAAPPVPHEVARAQDCLRCHGVQTTSSANITSAGNTALQVPPSPVATATAKAVQVPKNTSLPGANSTVAAPSPTAVQPVATQKPASATAVPATAVAVQTTPTLPTSTPAAPTQTKTVTTVQATVQATATATEDPVWPPVMPRLAARLVSTETGHYVVFTTWVENRSTSSYSLIDLKGTLPAGMQYIDSYAGVPTQNKGGWDGTTVGWVHHGLDVGKKEGPFVFVAKITGNTAPGSKYGGRVQLAWVGDGGGTFASSEASVVVTGQQSLQSNETSGLPSALDMLKDGVNRNQDTYYTKELLSGQKGVTGASQNISQSGGQEQNVTVTGGVVNNSGPASNTKIVSRDTSGKIINQQQGSFFRLSEVPRKGTVEFDSLSDTGVAAKFEVNGSWQFNTVTLSKLSYNPAGSVPPGRALRYFDIHSSQSGYGRITVKVQYSREDTRGLSEDSLKLYHFNNGVWEQVPTRIDKVNGYLAGTVTSLSPFALTSGSSQPATQGGQTGIQSEYGAMGVTGGNGPHGGYESMTDKCAGCHRAHTALGSKLLIAAREYDFCTTCHGGGATGAGTNVEDGKWKNVEGSQTQGQGTVNGRLNGGGFKNIDGAAVSSAHDVEGLSAAGNNSSAIAWGGGNGQNVTGLLKCSSCHNPHGSTNYRILRDAGTTTRWNATNANAWQNDQVDIAADDVSKPGGTKKYTYVDDVMKSTASWTLQSNKKITTAYSEGMSNFCATCHTQYLKTTAGTWSAGVGMGDRYANGSQVPATTRHAHGTAFDANLPMASLRSPLPVASMNATGTAGQDRLTCLTCHFAHGSTASMNNFAAGGDVLGASSDGSTTKGVAPTNDSALLFYNNRGVCEGCHNKGAVTLP